MKQKQIIQACKVLERLYDNKLPLSVSYKLYKLRNMLQEQWEFQQEKESELFKKYDVGVDPDGTLVFESDEAQEEFKKEFTEMINELAELDVDFGDFKKTILHFDDGLDLSMSDIDALSEFVDFVE